MSIVRFAKKYRRAWYVPKDKRVGVLAEPCWHWRGKLKDGYGRIRVHGVITRAHRYAFALYRGPIPDGKVLDHLCRNRACVNPHHLDPVTNLENTMRGENFAALNKAKTACPKGHAYDIENTYVDGRGRRYCRTCARERKRAA